MKLEKDFLLWRLPNQPKAMLYRLEQSNQAQNESVIIAPFAGKANTYKILESTEVEINALEIDVPEKQGPTVENGFKESHVALVSKAVARLQEDDLEKVVLARNKQVSGKPKPTVWFEALAQAYPSSCVFLFNTAETGMWMGATPETLLQVENEKAKANSLAGTRPADSKGNWGEKEREEQRIVTDEIVSVFQANGIENIQLDRPKTKVAGPVAHLFTQVSGDVPSTKNPLAIAENLHPTPAVGGLPGATALNYIREHEKLNRNYYAGYFGIASAEKAQFFVNLRCMELFSNGVVLYAGGGITAASNPEAEWEETERKLQTLLAIIEDEKTP